MDFGSLFSGLGGLLNKGAGAVGQGVGAVVIDMDAGHAFDIDHSRVEVEQRPHQEATAPRRCGFGRNRPLVHAAIGPESNTTSCVRAACLTVVPERSAARLFTR